MAKKLSNTQKQKNKVMYRQIRKGWEETDKSITYKQFKARVEAQKVANNLNTRQAVRKVINSEQFTSAAERSRENLIASLKENFREEYNEIRNLSRERGRFKAIKNNLTWDKDRNGYTFIGNGILYFIDVSNSPEEVNIYAI